jgi:hypothetical protein
MNHINYLNDNRVFTILLDDALPEELNGLTNAMEFNHYSILATVGRNWGLGNSGRVMLGLRISSRRCRN